MQKAPTRSRYNTIDGEDIMESMKGLSGLKKFGGFDELVKFQEHQELR